MDVPAEEEGGVAAEREGGDEVVPGWHEEELEESGLELLVQGCWLCVVAARTICAASVRINVMRGVICGRTANDVSPTRPRVTLLIASRSTGSFRYGAAVKH